VHCSGSERDIYYNPFNTDLFSLFREEITAKKSEYKKLKISTLNAI
jgi:hypothetical protein